MIFWCSFNKGHVVSDRETQVSAGFRAILPFLFIRRILVLQNKNLKKVAFGNKEHIIERQSVTLFC